MKPSSIIIAFMLFYVFSITGVFGCREFNDLKKGDLCAGGDVWTVSYIEYSGGV